jgi:hypothetical protein
VTREAPYSDAVVDGVIRGALVLSISLGVLFALALLLIITRVVSYALEVEFQSRKHGHADPMATICAERKRGLFLAALAGAGTSVGKRVISGARAMADITSAKGRSHTFDARVGEPHLRKTVLAIYQGATIG